MVPRASIWKSFGCFFGEDLSMAMVPLGNQFLPSSLFFLSVAASANCWAIVVLATLVWSQISSPSSHPGIERTHTGVVSF